ncbi:MAG TPA: aminotransferase class I/II-fold pyridoxal phosphate-dependent enzyme [Syntrophomonadaceae bacterium]|nr:aminotransferase class I/II-fold pyridoxal phosphate-dependent enzyme [Syntrophomonadaceae bacterium]
MKLQEFKLERFFARHEFSSTYLLCSSDCESYTVEELLNMAGTAGLTSLLHMSLGYTEGPGCPELRKQISSLYEKPKERNIFVTSGAEEAIFLFMNAVLAPGDHVIVQYPCYQSLYELGRSIGCQMSKWEMQESNGWAPDLDDLRKNLRKNTRAVIVNLPHNPTGFLMPRDHWQTLVNMLQERNILLFSDEVYRWMEYDEADRLPAACDLYDNAVSLGVMSKSFGLAGLRIGWIATLNHRIYQQLAAFKDYTSICNSAPSEFLSTIALQNKELIIKRNRQIIVENLQITDDFFLRHPDHFAWVKPRAGSVAFPRMTAVPEADSFCARLLTTQGVLLLPGSCYDYPHHFRIGLGRKNLPACIDKLEHYLRESL